MTLSPDPIIRAVPDWAGQEPQAEPLCPDVISPVHRGVESALWRVRPAGRPAAVIKALHPDVIALFDPAAAVAGARLASGLGVGPRLLWSDPDSGALAMEDLGAGWRTATLYDLQDETVLAATFDAIRRFQTGGRLEARFNVFDEIGKLAEAIVEQGATLPFDGWWMRDLVADIGAAIDSAGFDPAPCRNDGVSSNIMISDAGGVMLLDYDRAGMNDPLYDIAVLLTEACAFPSELENRLSRWLGHDDPRAANRCILYGAADDLMWGLWAALCDRTSARRHVEFRKYAEWRFLRCRATLGDPRLEERLRHL